MFEVSYALLWVLVLVLVVGFLSLGRQIGLIHRRIPPSGSREGIAGPAIGDAVEPTTLELLDGTSWVLPSGRVTFLLFISATCGLCESIAGSLKSLARSDGGQADFLLISLSEPEPTRKFVDEHGLAGFPTAADRARGEAWGVMSSPYAMAIDAEGRVVSKGLVNHLEHLESVFDEAFRPEIHSELEIVSSDR